MKRFYSIIVCFLLLSAGIQAQCALSPGTQATPTMTNVLVTGMNAPTGLTGQSTGAGIVTEFILTDPATIVTDTGYDPTDPNDVDYSGEAIVATNLTGQFAPMGMFNVGQSYNVTAFTYELGAVQTAIDNITGSQQCCDGITVLVEVLTGGPLPGGANICQLLAGGGITSGADVTSLSQVLALVGAFGNVGTIPAISGFLNTASQLSNSACVGVTACGLASNAVGYSVVADCTTFALNLSVACDAGGAASGTLSIVASGGDGNYTITGATDGMPVANGQTVTVTATDGAGCTSTQSLTATCPGFTLCPDGSMAQAPGTACDDGDATTTGDVIMADGCTCAGTAAACNVLITETNYFCDEDAGEFTYTWSFTGGAPSADPLEVYTINGTNVLNQQLNAGQPLSVTYPDGTAVTLTAEDSNGCSYTWSTPGPIACTKTCPADIVADVVYFCDEDASVFTYTVTLSGGEPAGDPTLPYTISGTNIATPLEVFIGQATVFSFADGTAVNFTFEDDSNCSASFSSNGPVTCSKDCPSDIVITPVFDCDQSSGVFTYTWTISGGVPSTDPLESYTVTGSGIGAPLAVAGNGSFAVSYSDGTPVVINVTDSGGCTATFDSGGPVACVKLDDCPGAITIAEVFDCDEEAGVFTYTYTITGGVPGADPTAAYTVSGTGIGSPLSVFAGVPFTLSYTDGTAVNLNVSDSGGCAAAFNTPGPVACSKKDCPGDISIVADFVCDSQSGIFTYTYTITGGLPGTDPTEAYTVSGTGIGAPLSVFAGVPFALSYADGTAVVLSVEDEGGCINAFDSMGPVACSKDCPGDIFVSGGIGCDELTGVFTYTFNITGGLPGTDAAESYTVTGTGIGTSLTVSANQSFSLSYNNGTAVVIDVTDSAGCVGTFSSGGPVPCGGGSGCVCAISPAQLTWADGSTTLTVCEGSATATGTASIAVAPNAPNGAFIITDASGTQILDGPLTGPDFSFTNAPAGTCQLWHVAWDCDFTLPASGLVADIAGDCWMLSNPLTVVRAPIDGGKIVDGPTNSESLVVCINDETLGHKVTVTSTIPPTGSQSAIIVTDETGTTIIAGPSPGPIYDFLGAGIGTYLVWQVTWNGNINIPDNQVANITADCWALSNPITVYAIDCDPVTAPDCLQIAFAPGPIQVCTNVVGNFAATITMNSTNPSVINYGLYTGPNGSGTLLASNNTGAFSFTDIPGGSINTTYYVAAVTGNDANNDGIADAGLCFQSWGGPAVSFVDCPPPTDCATVGITQGLQIACPGESVSAVATVTNANAGDIVVYAVHDGMNGSVGNVLATNSTGVFNSTMLNAPSYSAQYNLSVLVGPDNNGDGIPDQNDPCFQVVYGPYVTFLGEVFVNTEIICNSDDNEVTLNYFIQGGLPSFDEFALYTVTGDITGTYSASQMPITVTYTLPLESVTITAYDPFCDSEEEATYLLDCDPKPIELTDFDATARDADNLVTWTTATEINNDYFVLERSQDGIYFDPIQTIDGAGSTIYSIDYSFVDTDVEDAGTYYYRLTQFDYNGLSSTSDVVYVKRGSTESSFGVSPVPATSVINVYLDDLNLEEKVTVAIFDISGKQLDKIEGTNLNPLLQVDIDYLPTGVYFVSANDGNFVYTTKFIKE